MSAEDANTKKESTKDETESTIAMDTADSVEDIELAVTTSHEELCLCCPLTKKPFREPVVHPNGQTYELRAIRDQFANVKCYPNRALQHYLDSKIKLTNELNDSNEIFHCPLSHKLLRDPVIDPEGHTFERCAVLEWIREHGVSPITQTPLSPNQLYNNSIILILLLQTIHQTRDYTNEDTEDWKRKASTITVYEEAKQDVAEDHLQAMNQETEEINQSSSKRGANPVPFSERKRSLSDILWVGEESGLPEEAPNQTLNERSGESALLCFPELSRTKWLIVLASILAAGLIVLILVSPWLASCALAVVVAGVLAVCHLGS